MSFIQNNSVPRDLKEMLFQRIASLFEEVLIVLMLFFELSDCFFW